MSGEYLNLRLVRPADGETLYWFCPAEITDSVSKNNLFVADRAKGKGTIAVDKRTYRIELVIQGYAIPTSEMQPDHRAAMQARFGASNVSARAQIRYLKALAEFVGGTYHLYAYEDRYAAATVDDLDYSAQHLLSGHTYPPVTFDEIRYNPEPGKARIPYMVKFVVGFPSSSGSA